MAIKSGFWGQYLALLTSPSWLIFWMISNLAVDDPYDPISGIDDSVAQEEDGKRDSVRWSRFRKNGLHFIEPQIRSLQPLIEHLDTHPCTSIFCQTPLEAPNSPPEAWSYLCLSISPSPVGNKTLAIWRWFCSWPEVWVPINSLCWM